MIFALLGPLLIYTRSVSEMNWMEQIVQRKCRGKREKYRSDLELSPSPQWGSYSSISDCGLRLIMQESWHIFEKNDFPVWKVKGCVPFLWGHGWCVYSFSLPNPATRECVDFLCRKCFLIATKIPVCGKGQPSSSPSFLPLPQQKLSLWPI